MQNITVSLNPSYLCNLRCEFCYLSPAQLADTYTMPIPDVSSHLEAISQQRSIIAIDLYGGEPTMLPKAYVERLMYALMFHVSKVRVNTNGTIFRDYFLDDFFELYVSYDYDAREDQEKAFQTMLQLDEHRKPYGINLLVSEKILQRNPKDLVKELSPLKFLTGVEMKPYSQNQNNQQAITHKQHEDFVLAFIKACQDTPVKCVNESLIRNAVDGKGHSFSDEHVYLTPKGLAVLEFDLNDREYFLPMKDFNEYLDWTQQEKRRVSSNSICSKCEYLGKCLSEHLREVKDMTNSCNGYYNLLKHFEINPSKV